MSCGLTLQLMVSCVLTYNNQLSQHSNTPNLSPYTALTESIENLLVNQNSDDSLYNYCIAPECLHIISTLKVSSILNRSAPEGKKVLSSQGQIIIIIIMMKKKIFYYFWTALTSWD